MSRLNGGALLAGKAGAAWTYALRDHQGSTRGLYDGSKTATGSLEYTPYGESYAASGTSPRFQYTGKEWDATAKLYYFPYRYYSPERARWLTRAPLGMVDGPNVYAYVAGNPVNKIDPMGTVVYPGTYDLPVPWRLLLCAALALGVGALIVQFFVSRRMPYVVDSVSHIVLQCAACFPGCWRASGPPTSHLAYNEYLRFNLRLFICIRLCPACDVMFAAAIAFGFTFTQCMYYMRDSKEANAVGKRCR